MIESFSCSLANFAIGAVLDQSLERFVVSLISIQPQFTSINLFRHSESLPRKLAHNIFVSYFSLISFNLFSVDNLMWA